MFTFDNKELVMLSLIFFLLFLKLVLGFLSLKGEIFDNCATIENISETILNNVGNTLNDINVINAGYIQVIEQTSVALKSFEKTQVSGFAVINRLVDQQQKLVSAASGYISQVTAVSESLQYPPLEDIRLEPQTIGRIDAHYNQLSIEIKTFTANVGNPDFTPNLLFALSDTSVLEFFDF